MQVYYGKPKPKWKISFDMRVVKWLDITKINVKGTIAKNAIKKD